MSKPHLLTGLRCAGAIICLFLGLLHGLAQEKDENMGLRERDPSPDKYTFSMKLPPGTDCLASKKVAKPKGDSADSPPPDLGSMRLRPVAYERSFREGICQVREIYSDGSDTSFYFAGGLCVFDDARKGINVRHQEEGRKYSEMDTYHFPELLWARPGTRLPEPKPKEGEPPPSIRIYQSRDEGLRLEVDAKTGRPLHFKRFSEEWTYSYKESTTPIVVPEKLMNALNRGNSKKDQ